jgi:hypothetical protein
MSLMPERRTLDRARLLDFIGGLETEGGPSMTLYSPPGTPAADLEILMRDVPIASDLSAHLLKHSGSSPTGSVIFWSNGRLVLVLPPFPVAEKLAARALETGPLRSALSRDYRIGLVLVRLGSYAVGVCQGEKLVTSKVGTGLVHGRHRQGGSSAHRFERHRDKQIEYFLTRVCRHAREHLEPYVKSFDFLVYGGARTTILLLQKQCPFLGKISAPSLPPLLDIPEPRQAVLEGAVRRLYSGTVIEWRG